MNRGHHCHGLNLRVSIRVAVLVSFCVAQGWSLLVRDTNFRSSAFVGDDVNQKWARVAAGGAHPAFEVVQAGEIGEIGVNFTLYRHLKSGAEVLSIVSDDTNKVFGIAFRTPSVDSTGVAHILEHSVLCGSRKYPLKDPFAQLRKFSLQTYLNAFTYPDRTVYPVASQNLKDFYNLANVYLDATLHPRAIEDPQVLAQEGWHYELESPDVPVIYKGIVYNEMKGVYSASDSRLEQEAMKSLFPDTTYRFDSGGDPREIPSLTFEGVRSFYEQHYHPSNARIFFYGDDPVEERLKLLESYLSEYSMPLVSPELTRVETQKKWDAPRRIQAPYPVTAQQASSPEGAKHSVHVVWLLNEEPLTPLERFGLSMLSSLLLGDSTAPLHEALTNSHFGDTVAGGGYSDELKQATFEVGLKGIKKEHVSDVEALIEDTLKKVAEEGFPDGAVSATMNSIEFGVREYSSASTNKGMGLYLSALKSWVYDGDPVERLKFETALKLLQAQVRSSDQSFLVGLMNQFLIENKHRLTIEGVPDATMSSQEEEAEKTKLRDFQSRLNASQVANLIKSTAELQAAQNTPDPPEVLRMLPMLSLSDLERREKDLDMTVLVKDDVTYLTHVVNSNGIIYADILFDLAPLPISYLPMLPLFMGLLFDVGTSTLEPANFTRQIGARTGGIAASKICALKSGANGSVGDPNAIVLKLMVSGKSVAEQVGDLFELMKMGIRDSKLDSQSKALDILKSTRATMENSLRTAGSTLAQTRLQARRSLAGYVDEILGGITFYDSLEGLIATVEKDWPKVLTVLLNIRALLLDKDSLLINLAGDKHALEAANAAVEVFLKSLLADTPIFNASEVGPLMSDAMRGSPSLRLTEENEGFVVSTQVNYVVKGGGLYSPGDHVSGDTAVVVRLISQGYMWDKIRVLGGAYGGGCLLSQFSGTFFCYSYRDPNLEETIAVFDDVAAHLEGLKLDSGGIEQLIVGSVGDLDKPMTPPQKSSVSMLRWLMGSTLEMRQRRRDEIFSTTMASFEDFAQRLRNSSALWRSSIFGSKTALHNTKTRILLRELAFFQA